MRIKILGLGICFLWILQVSLFAEKAVILKQDDVPLKISDYKSSYSSYERRDKIIHTVTCVNASEKKIVAIKIGLVTFDAFNDFLDKTVGISIKDVVADKPNKRTWSQSPYGAFKFEKYGTGVAYVEAVRFEDGMIWESDKSNIVSQIQEIQESFTADLLGEKKEEK